MQTEWATVLSVRHAALIVEEKDNAGEAYAEGARVQGSGRW